MERELMSLDWAIKGVLRDKANFDILSGLFSELLGRTVEVVDLLESESNAERANGKINRLDLKAKLEDGETVVFELQVDNESDFFHRLLWGTSKTVTEQVGKGEEYEKIKKVYTVAIVYFELGKGSDYVYRGSTDFKGIHNNDTLLLSENQKKYLSTLVEGSEPGAGALFPEYYLIYPKRFDERIRNRFDEWVFTFKTSKVRPEFTAAGIQKAGEELDVRRMSKGEYNDYQAHLKIMRVRSNEISTALYDGEVKGLKKGEVKGLKKGRAEGLKEGKAEGLKKGKAEGLKKGKAEGLAEGEKRKALEIAKTMKAKGMDVNTISEITKLTPAEIGRL